MNGDAADNIALATKIENEEEYDQIHRRLHALIDLGFDNLSPEQGATLDHLANLIEAYDREHDAD